MAGPWRGGEPNRRVASLAQTRRASAQVVPGQSEVYGAGIPTMQAARFQSASVRAATAACCGLGSIAARRSSQSLARFMNE